MIGAIIGDIAGSTYEFHSIKTKDFPLFAPGSSYTDDSLMSVAVASALMQTGESHDGFKSHAVTSMRQIATKYPCPMGGYGRHFRHWLVSSDPQPYGRMMLMTAPASVETMANFGFPSARMMGFIACPNI